MLKSLLVSAALTGAALVAPLAASAAVSGPASAAAYAPTVVAAQACTYRRSGNVWRCITPGAYCPKEAHGRYGYSKTTGARYRCTQYDKGSWRWKRA